MTAPLSVLLDDGGAHIVATAAQADDLLSLFSAHGVACERSAAADGAKIQIHRADQILRAHSLLQDWLKRQGLRRTLHEVDPAADDTRHS